MLLFFRNESKKLKSIIEKEISKLSNEEKKMIFLYFNDGMKIKEIAEVLGIETSQVYNTILKIMSNLKNTLEKIDNKLVINNLDKYIK